MRKDLSKYKFFVKPCFICSYMTWESGEGEYGTGGSYPICEAQDEIYEKWQEDKPDFPNCECPKRCIRKNIFRFNRNFDTMDMYDYYSILSTMDYGFGGVRDGLASKIASNISSFNTRLRQYNKRMRNESII